MTDSNPIHAVPKQTFTELQREALSGYVLRQLQSQIALERFFNAFPEPEREPIPWYGHLRNRMSDVFYWFRDLFEGWSEACAGRAADMRWYRRPTTPINTGQVIHFRRWAPLQSGDERKTHAGLE